MSGGVAHREQCASFDRAASGEKDEKVKACCDDLTAWTAGLRLSEGSAMFVKDRRNLLRYAIARKGNVEGARKQLGKALEWRDKHLPPPGMPHRCERCEEGGKNTHCFFSIGLDKLGRNVLYANSARALCNEAQGCVLHMTRTLEIGFARPEVAEKWVWIIDFNGFTMKQALQIKTSVAVMQCFGDIMPERVGMIVLVNAPVILRIILEAVKPFVDERTMSKVVRAQIKPGTTDMSSISAVKDLTSEQQEWLGRALGSDAKPGKLPNLGALDTSGLNFPTGVPTEG